MDREPTIYVAGPMRGHTDYNYPAFDRQARILKMQGWDVINPAALDREAVMDAREVDYDDEFLREALKRDMVAICDKCTAVYMMSGWEKSTGAKTEWALAKALGLEIYYEAPLPKGKQL